MENSKTAITPKGDTAAIQSATVDVSVIRIGKRQLTQSVFRQLPEWHCVDSETMTPIGNWWGFVRYNFGDFEDTTPLSFHILFEWDGSLYRCYHTLKNQINVFLPTGEPVFVGDRHATWRTVTFASPVSLLRTSFNSFCLVTDDCRYDGYRFNLDDSKPLASDNGFAPEVKAIQNKICGLEQLFIAT